MNKLQVIGVSIAALLIPSVVVLAINGDKIVGEDRSAGTLYYFQGG